MHSNKVIREYALEISTHLNISKFKKVTGYREISVGNKHTYAQQ
jgi:hypothetical protein